MCKLRNILFLSFFVACSTSNKIVENTITYETNSVEFLPSYNSKNIADSLILTIEPIDASILNKETFEASERDGSYNKEFIKIIESRKNELKKLSKSDRILWTGKINAIEELNKIEKYWDISFKLIHQLKQMIWYDQEYLDEVRETYGSFEATDFSDIFNPYKINNKFLSLFKLTFVNEGGQIERVGINNIQVISGNELLYPLNMEFFESTLKDDPDRIQNIYRLNMVEELVLTPRSNISKYISMPPINSRNEFLQVQFIVDDKVINYDFKVKDIKNTKEYLVEEYEILTKLEDSRDYYMFYGIEFPNGKSFASKSAIINLDKTFIAENKSLKVYTVAINKRNGNSILLRNNNVLPEKVKNNRIFVSAQ